MRGRKPKPTWLKIIGGNPGGRPLNPHEPVPKDPLTDAPTDFSDAQKAIWDHAMKAAPPGLLTELDRHMLVNYCVAADLHHQARLKIQQFGPIIKAPQSGVPMQSPYMAVLNKQAQIMQKCMSEMGFTPSSRSRVKVEPRQSDTASASVVFDDLKELPEQH
jgi:P27 family predicted phage terminase small subunit